MRFFIFLRGYGLLVILAFLIGITRPPLKPEKVSVPKTAEDFVYRGELYAKDEEYEKALADYNRAEQLHPVDRYCIYHSIYLNQAVALTELNRPAEAIEKYQKVKQIQQQDGLSTGLVDQEITALQKQLQHRE